MTDAPMQWPADFPPTWAGVPQKPLLELLGPALRDGKRPFLYFDDGFALDGPTLYDLISRFSASLAARVKPGERVLLACGNRAEYLVGYLSIIAVRCAAVPVGPEMGPEDVAHVINGGQCAVAIAEPSAAEAIARVAERCPTLRETITISGEEPNGLVHEYRGEERLDLVSIDADVDDITDVGFTSGTTGLPKALPGGHLEWLRYIDIGLRVRPPQGEDRVLVALQFHYGDPVVAIFQAILSGTAAIAMRRFSVSRFWEVAKSLKATQIVTIGSIPNLLLTARESSAERDHRIRFAVAVGIPRDHHAALEARFGFPWYEVYGSTEAGPAIAMPFTEGAKYVGTGALGIPYPDVKARLVDGDGNVVDGVGDGELEMSGEILFEGYEGNDEANAEVMHDGWLRSGDLMRRDERGVYYFLGRRKELIRRGGENAAPAEVEAVLRLHPSVIDAAVVPVPDDLQGEEIKAYVEVRPGDLATPEQLAAHCAANLARFKVPRYIALRSEPFPRTPSQRILKSALKVDGEHVVSDSWDRRAVQ